jgi:hypothetical protein
MSKGKTVSELFNEGVTKMRREPWNPYAYVELTATGEDKDGKRFHGPWVTLHDIRSEPFKILITEIGATEPVWEPWHPPKEESGERSV